jgi:hypothetical protein
LHSTWLVITAFAQRSVTERGELDHPGFAEIGFRPVHPVGEQCLLAGGQKRGALVRREVELVREPLDDIIPG